MIATPRDAATVIVLREGAPFEVYLVRRAQAIAFMGGAHVFPGGRKDERDPSIEAAAVREVREEIGIDIAQSDLVPWARWITPEIEPKRFDARFFVTLAPPGAAPRVADSREVTEALWIAPREALARAEWGEMFLPPPTLWNLHDLADYATAADAIAAARAGRDLTPIMPRALPRNDGTLVLVLPGDPSYEDPTADPPIEAQRRFVLASGRWTVRRGSPPPLRHMEY